MPRGVRLDAPGALHHVMSRGLERGTIFRDRADYTRFLHRLGTALEKSRTRCFAWALMPNHIHLLLQTGDRPVARVMQRLLTGYAVSYNHRWKRTGHLFGGRYKSLLCEADAYLRELVRYIHLNPARAGLCAGLEGLAKYPWTGHRVLLGKAEAAWQETDAVLEEFGTRRGPARDAYLRFLGEGLKAPADPRLAGEGLRHLAEGGWEAVKQARRSEEVADERILGSRTFMAKALATAEEQERIRSRLRRSGLSNEEVIRLAAKAAGLPVREVAGSGKRPAQVLARALVCYWLVEKLGRRESEVARRLGITQPAVSAAIHRGLQAATERKLTLGRG